MKTYTRGIPIASELSLNGPKDAFIEDINTNIELIHKRIQSTSLKECKLMLGRYTNTKISILYLDDIVKMSLVNHILKALNNIDIDGIIDSSYLKEAFERNDSLFPTIMMSERPDKCSMALLEGKVILLVDNSPYALILPCLLWDFFHTTDDYYQKAIHTSFIRIIRFFAFLIAIFTPAFYIAVTTRNYSIIPFPLLLLLKAGRTFVPFPAYLEALFMILCFEILKESDLRMSSTSGSSISILGGLILGDAAVAAGIVSPIMIIVIAISSISGLVFNSVELGNALRFYKIFLLFFSVLFGLIGIVFGFILFMIHLSSTKIFGYSYLYLSKSEWLDSIIRIPTRIKKRNSKLSNNIIRGHYQ